MSAISMSGEYLDDTNDDDDADADTLEDAGLCDLLDQLQLSPTRGFCLTSLALV